MARVTSCGDLALQLVVGFVLPEARSGFAEGVKTIGFDHIAVIIGDGDGAA